MTKAEREAVDLLDRFHIIRPPIPVEQIVKKLGATIELRPFQGQISGMLYRDDHRRVIGVNSREPEVRRRFTVAHEIAHLVLHKGRQMIIDTPARYNLRRGVGSVASDREEVEANAFAAELLMPRDMVMAQWQQNTAKRAVPPSQLVGELATKFDVSTQAMGYRLVNLGIRQPR
jgi:Zn-dependent peptidase ImmA (M78 family)